MIQVEHVIYPVQPAGRSVQTLLHYLDSHADANAFTMREDPLDMHIMSAVRADQKLSQPSSSGSVADSTSDAAAATGLDSLDLVSESKAPPPPVLWDDEEDPFDVSSLKDKLKDMMAAAGLKKR